MFFINIWLDKFLLELEETMLNAGSLKRVLVPLGGDVLPLRAATDSVLRDMTDALLLLLLLLLLEEADELLL